jgi:hypothetical protein
MERLVIQDHKELKVHQVHQDFLVPLGFQVIQDRLDQLVFRVRPVE